MANDKPILLKESQSYDLNLSLLKLSNGIDLVRCSYDYPQLKTIFVTFKHPEFKAYFAMTKFYEKLIVRVHADFKPKMQNFTERFVKSFCDFQHYLGQEYIIENIFRVKV